MASPLNPVRLSSPSVSLKVLRKAQRFSSILKGCKRVVRDRRCRKNGEAVEPRRRTWSNAATMALTLRYQGALCACVQRRYRVARRAPVRSHERGGSQLSAIGREENRTAHFITSPDHCSTTPATRSCDMGSPTDAHRTAPTDRCLVLQKRLLVPTTGLEGL